MPVDNATSVFDTAGHGDGGAQQSAHCGAERLANVWVYLKRGDEITRLRSDADGLLLTSNDADPTIASFVEPWVTEAPSTVVLGSSRNGLPLPSAVLGLVSTAFTEVALDLAPEHLAPLPSAPIASHETNTIQAVPMLKVVLPPTTEALEKLVDDPDCSFSYTGPFPPKGEGAVFHMLPSQTKGFYDLQRTEKYGPTVTYRAGASSSTAGMAWSRSR